LSETPKQRIRRILDRLPLDEEARRAFDEALEQVSEEDCGDMLEVYDDLLEEQPDLLEQIIEALEAARGAEKGP